MRRQVVRRGGGFGTFLMWLLGIIMGIVLTLGGIVGAGYFAVSQNIGTVLDKVGVDSSFLAEDVKKLSILAYGQNVYGAFSDIDNMTIGELEETVGTNKLSELMEKTVGVEASIISTSKLSNIGQTVSDNLTVYNIEDKFGVSFPDIPLFAEESFLNEPISSAFANMMDYNLDSFIDVVYDADATEGKEASSAFLQKIGSMSMDAVSEDMDSIIQGTTLKELMEIGETSPRILQVLKDCALETQYNEDDTVATMGLSDRLDSITLDEVVETGDSYMWNYLRTATLNNIGAKVDDMSMADLVEVKRDEFGSIIYNENGKMTNPEGTEINAVIAKMITYVYYDDGGAISSIGLKVSDMDSKLGGIIESMTLGEMIKLPADAEPILVALKDTKLTGGAINAKIKTLTIADVFEDTSTGVLALVPESTMLTDISGEITDAVSTSSMYKLIELEIFEANMSSLTPEKKAIFLNSKAEDIIQNYVDMLSGSKTPADLAGAKIDIGVLGNTDTITLTNDVLNTYNVGFGDTIYCKQNVVIADGTVFDRAFNIVVDTNVTLDISGTASIEIGTDPTYLDSGYMYISGNVRYNTVDYPIASGMPTIGEDALGNDIEAVSIDYSKAIRVI